MICYTTKLCRQQAEVIQNHEVAVNLQQTQSASLSWWQTPIISPTVLSGHKIMKMRMSAILDKAKPNTENIRGLNLAAVKCLDCRCSVSYMICCTEHVLTYIADT
jgi:hypothetical protein